MSAQSMDQRNSPTGYLPEGADINRNIAARRLRGAIWEAIVVS
jgi:phosphate transport system permease protein